MYKIYNTDNLFFGQIKTSVQFFFFRFKTPFLNPAHKMNK